MQTLLRLVFIFRVYLNLKLEGMCLKKCEVNPGQVQTTEGDQDIDRMVLIVKDSVPQNRRELP